MQNIKETPTNELIDKLDKIDNKILQLIDEYYMCREELTSRFPFFENETFELTIFKGEENEKNRIR